MRWSCHIRATTASADCPATWKDTSPADCVSFIGERTLTAEISASWALKRVASETLRASISGTPTLSMNLAASTKAACRGTLQEPPRNFSMMEELMR